MKPNRRRVPGYDELQAAINDAYRIIWHEDAAYVKDGDRMLDDWAERHRHLVSDPTLLDDEEEGCDTHPIDWSENGG